jgi:hypothetical protein
LRLRGKHAIKRVPVGAGQRACSSGMSNRDVKALKLLAGNTRRYITRNFSGSREFAESELRCDFPGGGGTDEYGIRFLANDSPRGFLVNRVSPSSHPQKCMGIQQYVHFTVPRRSILLRVRAQRMRA